MKRKKLLIGISVLILSGCIVRFIYNHLDWIIPWYVGKMISLNDDQASELEKSLMAQLKWHRVTQLSEYSNSLKELNKAVQTDLNKAHMDRFHLTMRRYWQDLVRHVGPDLARILSTATDAQVKELMESLRERNRKFREKYIDPPEEELREVKVDRMTQFLEFCLGDVTEQQEKFIEQWSRELKNISAARLEYIQLRQARFRKIMERRKDLEWFTQELCELFYFKRETWPDEFRKIAEHNRELTKQFFLKLHQSMTDGQKEEFAENALSLAEDFDILAKDV